MPKKAICPATGQPHRWRPIGIHAKKGHTVEIRECFDCKARIGVRV